MQISRSEQKRRAKALEQLVAELVTLSPQQLGRAPVSAEIVAACSDAAGLQGGARKRQIKYIAKMLRIHPHEELFSFLADVKGAKHEANRQLHEVEFLRNALVEEALEQYRRYQREQLVWEEDWPSRVVEDICTQLPDIDARDLRRLGYLFARTRNPRHSREIFRIIRAAREARGPRTPDPTI